MPTLADLMIADDVICRLGNLQHGVWNEASLGFRISDLGPETQSGLGIRIWPRLGAWDSAFGIWDLGLGDLEAGSSESDLTYGTGAWTRNLEIVNVDGKVLDGSEYQISHILVTGKAGRSGRSDGLCRRSLPEATFPSHRSRPPSHSI